MMACHLFSVKPVSQPVLGYYQLDPRGTKFGEILIIIQNFSFMKMHLKISSATWQPFCPGGDELSPRTSIAKMLSRGFQLFKKKSFHLAVANDLIMPSICMVFTSDRSPLNNFTSSQLRLLWISDILFIATNCWQTFTLHSSKVIYLQ